ncbi:MAG: hypothetical protein QF371_00285 [Flavobacteriales bacterium]|jgi:hypothetical protein|nr:hypothetical protein [Flavobacteriales bacterium]
MSEPVKQPQNRDVMRSAIIGSILLCLVGTLEAEAQSKELYVFKNVRKERLKAARKARKEACERKVNRDFFMRVRTLASRNEAKVQVSMKRPHETELIIADMNGTQLASIHKGELEKGLYEFTYEPEGAVRKPFVCSLVIDGKTEAMRVVKFNSF